ncbi:hypothetical protein ES703_95743 [subsurface metagenome]
MEKFCDYLKEISTSCSTCQEDGVAACHIKLGEQEYYKGFQLYDTIHIIRHDHALSIETDIEVKYKTKFPYGAFAGKGAEFAAEFTAKEKAIRDSVKSQLPIGAKFLISHQHYNPDKRDPEVVAIHLHVHKVVEDLDEAKHIVEKLVEVIQPGKLEGLIA